MRPMSTMLTKAQLQLGGYPRRHGEAASKRGLSNEKICILTGSDRQGNEIIRAVGRAKPSSKDVNDIFATRIKKQSVLVNDGVYCYDQLIELTKAESRVVGSHQEYTPVFHLNVVNNMHSRWKRLWRHYLGVSTKYLNRYLALFTFMRKFEGMDCQEQLMEILKLLKNIVLIAPFRVVKVYSLLSI